MRMVVFPHAARIDVDHVLELVELILNLDHLVDLLLILDHGKAGAAMIQNIGHLFGGGVLIQRHRNGPHRLRGHHRPIEIGPVASDDRDEIALVHPQIDQAKRQSFDFLFGLRPGPALPDAEFLFAVSGPADELFGVPLKKRRNRA